MVKRVYIGDSAGILYCFDENLNLQWQVDIPPLPASGEINVPAVVSTLDNNLYISSVDDLAGAIRKINRTNGAIMWEYSLTDEVRYTNTVVDASENVYAIDYSDVFTSLDSTGALRWAVSATMESTPAISTDGTKIYANVGGWAVGNLCCLNAATGITLWTYDNGGAGLGLTNQSPALSPDDSVVYIVAVLPGPPGPPWITGWLHAVDALTGAGLWVAPVALDTSCTISAPSVDSNGNIYVTTHGTTLYKISPAGISLWSVAVGPANGEFPACIDETNGKLYCCGSGGNLKCYDLDGNLLWTSSEASNGYGGGALSTDGSALYVAHGSILKMLSTADGSLLASYPLDFYTEAAPSFDEIPELLSVIPWTKYQGNRLSLGRISTGISPTGNTATVFGYVLDPITGLGGGGSGEPISGAMITIGDQPTATTPGNGFYTITFPSTFAFNVPSTPLTVYAPNMVGIIDVLEVPANTSSEVDFYMQPTSVAHGSGSGGGGRVRRSGGTFRNPLNMHRGLKMKIK